MLHFYRGTVFTEQNSFHRLLCIFSTTEKEQNWTQTRTFFQKLSTPSSWKPSHRCRLFSHLSLLQHVCVISVNTIVNTSSRCLSLLLGNSSEDKTPVSLCFWIWFIIKTEHTQLLRLSAVDEVQKMRRMWDAFNSNLFSDKQLWEMHYTVLNEMWKNAKMLIICHKCHFCG